MMPTVIVSFREDEETLDFLRERGLNPNRFAKEAFHRHLHRLRVEGVVDRFRRSPARLDRPAEDILREIRDEK